jgi:hypothetical protein
MSIRKLGLCLNSFDCSEFLQYSISEIRDQLDYVIAIYQKKSYWGNPMDPIDMAELERLCKIGLIDELIEFKNQSGVYARQQETNKRNMGIEHLKNKGCSHVLIIDADELFEKEEFAKAKNFIHTKGYPITYCSYINYYKDFEHYLVYPFRPFIPFIHNATFNYTYEGPAPGPTDPTRRIFNPLNIGTYIFKDEEIRMHHMAWVRKSIRKKLENWSAKDHFNKELIDKAVERWENWKEGEDAIMLFNVPNNTVKIIKLNKRFSNLYIPWIEKDMQKRYSKELNQ